MDVPWWIGHNDMEFTKRRVVKGTEIAVDPLWRKLTIKTCMSDVNGAGNNGYRNEQASFRVQLGPCQSLAYESSSLAFFPSSTHHLHHPNQPHSANSGKVASLCPYLLHRVLKEGTLDHANLEAPSHGCGSFLGKEVLKAIAHM